MGRTGILIAAAALAAAALAPRAALACWQCDGIACVPAGSGGRACFLGVGGCVTWGRCGDTPPGGERDDAALAVPGDGAMALQMTWLLAERPPESPRVARGVGRRLIGEPAARALRAVAGGATGPAPVVAAVAGFGDAFDVGLRGAAGDGVALAWTAEGRGGRVVLRPLAGGAPVADERLADLDALVVPVRHGGRHCVLVVQPRVLPRLSLRLEREDLARTVRDAVRSGRVRLGVDVAAAAPRP
jgi:hypothetical protein